MNERREIPKILKRLSTTQLKRGMAAFSHPPRMSTRPCEGDDAGCFVYEAYRSTNLFASEDTLTLSFSYEENNEWLHSECLRELAERGVAVEPTVAEPVHA